MVQISFERMPLTARNQKLELTWIGKENRPKLEPRILLEDPEKSYHAGHRVSDRDLFDNRLIFGVKPLSPEGADRVSSQQNVRGRHHG